MAKDGASRAIVFAVFIGCSGAYAQTQMSPQDFVLASSQGDRYEELAATIALAQSNNPRVLAFAKDMMRDHVRLSADMRQVLEASSLPQPPSSVSSDEAAWLAGLQGARGTDFDATYARQQVLAHTQAVVLQESYAMSGSEPKLREAAQFALPTIRTHLKMSQQLSADVGGP